MTRLVWLLPLALLLSACAPSGMPTTDVEATMFGVVILGALVLVGFLGWCGTRR